MPVRFLSDAELARLSDWPSEIAGDDLVTYFTLLDDDLGWLAANYRPENRLGVAVQLCMLPWLELAKLELLRRRRSSRDGSRAHSV